jgi:hypothetical protein
MSTDTKHLDSFFLSLNKLFTNYVPGIAPDAEISVVN